MVLDLSRVLAGPYATQLLGDLGAEVWKVERAGTGDKTRAWGPPFVAGTSAYFLAVNRNKKSAALNFGTPREREAVRRAARAADVVVENFLPGDLEPVGLDAASLRRERPELIVCSITGKKISELELTFEKDQEAQAIYWHFFDGIKGIVL